MDQTKAAAQPGGVGGSQERAVTVHDAMRRRRMHRLFQDRPVAVEHLEGLLWAATRAQQARSGVRHLVAVDDPGLMRVARKILPGFTNNAPAMIVHCTDLCRAAQVLGSRGPAATTWIDAGAACAHLALAGQQWGIGVCTVTSWDDEAVRTLLQLPEHIRPDVTVAVGYVSPRPRAAARGFRTQWHHNRFGDRFDLEQRP